MAAPIDPPPPPPLLESWIHLYFPLSSLNPIVLLDGEQIMVNLDAEMRLGNTIEMDGVVFDQDRALVLLQDSRSNLRISVERALTNMVRIGR